MHRNFTELKEKVDRALIQPEPDLLSSLIFELYIFESDDNESGEQREDARNILSQLRILNNRLISIREGLIQAEKEPHLRNLILNTELIPLLEEISYLPKNFLPVLRSMKKEFMEQLASRPDLLSILPNNFGDNRNDLQNSCQESNIDNDKNQLALILEEPTLDDINSSRDTSNTFNSNEGVNQFLIDEYYLYQKGLLYYQAEQYREALYYFYLLKEATKLGASGIDINSKINQASYELWLEEELQLARKSRDEDRKYRETIQRLRQIQQVASNPKVQIEIEKTLELEKYILELSHEIKKIESCQKKAIIECNFTELWNLIINLEKLEGSIQEKFTEYKNNRDLADLLRLIRDYIDEIRIAQLRNENSIWSQKFTIGCWKMQEGKTSKDFDNRHSLLKEAFKNLKQVNDHVGWNQQYFEYYVEAEFLYSRVDHASLIIPKIESRLKKRTIKDTNNAYSMLIEIIDAIDGTEKLLDLKRKTSIQFLRHFTDALAAKDLVLARELLLILESDFFSACFGSRDRASTRRKLQHVEDKISLKQTWLQIRPYLNAVLAIIIVLALLFGAFFITKIVISQLIKNDIRFDTVFSRLVRNIKIPNPLNNFPLTTLSTKDVIECQKENISLDGDFWQDGSGSIRLYSLSNGSIRISPSNESEGRPLIIQFEDIHGPQGKWEQAFSQGDIHQVDVSFELSRNPSSSGGDEVGLIFMSDQGETRFTISTNNGKEFSNYRIYQRNQTLTKPFNFELGSAIRLNIKEYTDKLRFFINDEEVMKDAYIRKKSNAGLQAGLWINVKSQDTFINIPSIQYCK